MIAKATFHGRLTRDPDIRYTTGGTAVAQFSIAINRKWKDKNGETQESADFFEIRAWGTRADLVGKYLAKGDEVVLETTPKQDKWEDRDGSTRQKIIFDAQEISFVSGGRKDGERRAPAGSGRKVDDADVPTREERQAASKAGRPPRQGTLDGLPEDDDVHF